MQRRESAVVVPFQPRPGDLMKAIRLLSKDSGKVFFGKHARERMAGRGFSDRDALYVLGIGEIKGEITPGKQSGEWKCKIVAKLRGSREAGVVTIVLNLSQVFVKTVEWEDP